MEAVGREETLGQATDGKVKRKLIISYK